MWPFLSSGKQDNWLSPKDLGLLAKRLAATPDPAEAAHIREQLTRGFYGI
jgi:hypothetical protein